MLSPGVWMAAEAEVQESILEGHGWKHMGVDDSASPGVPSGVLFRCGPAA
jgi:hypothetical protein